MHAPAGQEGLAFAFSTTMPAASATKAAISMRDTVIVLSLDTRRG
jgi:hypothetical protein